MQRNLPAPALACKPGSTSSNGPFNGISRRRMLQAALAGSGALPAFVGAQQSDAGNAAEFVIRGGHVLTMDPALPDLPAGDVHVRDGVIVAVGPELQVRGARNIDARDMIVMPGFVDAHSHLWNAFLRGSVRGDDPVQGYFPTTNRAAPLCTPQDAYNSVRFGVAEALMGGITSVNNYSHNTRSPAHADAEIRAMLDTGIRGRFSYGPAGRADRVNLVDIERVQKEWLPGRPMLSLGVNLQLPPPDILKSGGQYEPFVTEVQAARRMGLPVSLHYGNTAHGLVAFMQARGLLGPDILLIHPQGYTAQERQTLVAQKVKFSTSPAIEIPYSTVRNGAIQFAELEEAGAQLSLSIDASSALATADFFTVMRALLWAHKQRADTRLKLTARRIVELATIEGARTLNLDGVTGSLTPGKRADIILVRRNDPNMAPVFEPYNSLVYSGQPANVDAVIVDGRIVRAGGQFRNLDIAEVVKAATASAVRVEAEMQRLLGKS